MRVWLNPPILWPSRARHPCCCSASSAREGPTLTGGVVPCPTDGRRPGPHRCQGRPLFPLRTNLCISRNNKVAGPVGSAATSPGPFDSGLRRGSKRSMIRREAMQQVRMNNWVSFPRVSRLSPWWSSPEQTTRASDAVFVTRRPASGNSVRPRRLASGWWRAAERFWRAIRRPFRCAGAIDILAGRHSPACAAARYAKARVGF